MRVKLFLAGLVMMLAQIAHAEAIPELAGQLRQAEADARAIERRAGASSEAEDRAVLRGRLATTRQSALAIAEQLSGQLASVDARIAELGQAPAAALEAPEVRKRRTDLAAERLSVDAAVKRARLLDIEAEQIGAKMQRVDAEQFGARMSRRLASPLAPPFWSAVLNSFDQDVQKIDRFLSEGRRQMVKQGVRDGGMIALVAAIIAAALIGPLRIGALRLGQRYLISDAPGLRLRRSAYAVWVMTVGTIAPVVASLVIFTAATVFHKMPPSWTGFLQTFVASVGFAAFTAAVFGALLMRRQPSWRLAPIDDAVAERLRPLSWTLAGITLASGLLDGFNTAVGASAPALAASMALQSGGSLLLIGGALIAIGRIQAAVADREDPVAPGPGLSLLNLALWIVVLTSLLALATGYLEFSQFLVSMIVWASVVCATAYLLMSAVDDLSTSIFSRGSRIGRTLVRGVGLGGSAIDQFGVVLSGGLRLILGLISLILLIAPFGAGSGVGSMIEKLASMAGGAEIGGVAVSPATIVRGVIVLLVGLALVRGFMAWLDRRYLPATDLDGSGRNSVSLIARYIGIAIATIWALASLGVGVEKIALLLSALSVGIGFGLQAITQNFISGLILLAERPIKIGDLIKVGNDEGDVKRISVRSTEIRLGDHSTLIIPNSELITKPVLNKTLASPLGRVQIQFSVPIDADAAAVERILLDAYTHEPAILRDPAPAVFIDAIADGRTVLNSFAAVTGPRAAYLARSNVLKALMRRLRNDGIDIGTTPQRVESSLSAFRSAAA